MKIVSESAQLSLAQRIAKVRNRMLVEVATGVSPTDKDLFVSLCQTYEQNSVEEFSASALPLYEASPYRTLSLLDLTQENMWRQLHENEQSKDGIWWQLRHGSTDIGFDDTNWSDGWFNSSDPEVVS